MAAKPIIILGGGLMGSLLALRLKQCIPYLPFKLLVNNSKLGISHSWSFHEGELSHREMEWIRPFITFEWANHKVRFENMERNFKTKSYTIFPDQLIKAVKKVVEKENIQVSQDMDCEKLLKEASFIIDTRMAKGQEVKCYRRTCGVLVELNSSHGIEGPVMLNTTMRQKDMFRYMQYLPVDNRSLLVNDIRFSKDKEFKPHIFEEELLWEIWKSWEIKSILHREVREVALTSSRQKEWREEGRIVNLSNFINPTTGDEFANAVKLVERMVQTSFRLGELKEVIKEVKGKITNRSRCSRLLSRMFYHSPHPMQRLQLLKYVYKLPEPTITKFLSDNLDFMDIGKSFLGNPPLPLMRAFPNII